MCALDWLSSPNIHCYQLWPSLTEEEPDQTLGTLSLTPGQRLGSNLASFDVCIFLWQEQFYMK